MDARNACFTAADMAYSDAWESECKYSGADHKQKDCWLPNVAGDGLLKSGATLRKNDASRSIQLDKTLSKLLYRMNQ